MQRTTAKRIAALGLLLLPAACIPAASPPPGYGYHPPGQYTPPAPPPRRAEPYKPRQQSVPPPQRETPRASTYQPRPEPPAPPPSQPAWLATPAPADARTIPASTYTVRPGDTLRSVGNATGAGANAIANANHLTAPFTLHAGQQLIIPGGRYHLVRPGQTGIAIARAYGVPWSRIMAANDLQEPYVLRAGTRLLIPGSGAPSVADRAAAFQLDVGDILSGGEPTPREDQPPAPPVSTATRALPPPTEPIAPPPRLRGGFAWPLQGRVVGHFGEDESGTKDNGIQIAVPVGTPIRASADGVVLYAGDEVAVLGSLVILRHGDGWSTVYGHASRILVQRGQTVKRGEIIAYSGDSGQAGRPELHFELRKGRDPVDPLGALAQRGE